MNTGKYHYASKDLLNEIDSLRDNATITKETLTSLENDGGNAKVYITTGGKTTTVELGIEFTKDLLKRMIKSDTNGILERKKKLNIIIQKSIDGLN